MFLPYKKCKNCDKRLTFKEWRIKMKQVRDFGYKLCEKNPHLSIMECRKKAMEHLMTEEHIKCKTN